MMNWRRICSFFLSLPVFAYAGGFLWALHLHAHEHGDHDSDHCAVCQSILNSANPAIVSEDLPAAVLTPLRQTILFGEDIPAACRILSSLIRGPPLTA